MKSLPPAVQMSMSMSIAMFLEQCSGAVVRLRMTHLLNEFTAERDVSPTEDVGHVFGNTQVVFLIRFGHLYSKRSKDKQ